MAAEEETDGIATTAKKVGDNDFRKNENKEPLPHVSEVSESTSSSSSVSQKNQSNTMNKGKSCKGSLYYSTAMKSNSRNPLCVGFTRSLPSVPRYIVRESETEDAKKGMNPRDFRYGCLGYSVYPDWKENRSSDKHESKTELPACFGLEIVGERQIVTADSASSQPRGKEDGTLTPAPTSGSLKPAHSFGGEFLTRFRRNSGLVALGVAKNIKRVGSKIKESVDDILSPYRRPPK